MKILQQNICRNNNNVLEENAKLCNSLGLKFIELNMNLPQYQVEVFST